MATEFLSKLQHLDDNCKKVVQCFLNEVKLNVEEHFGEKFWTEEKPAEIIDMANALCHRHEENQETFPISKETVIDLMYVLFRWMYK